MTTEEFVKEFYVERRSLIDTYFNKDTPTYVSELISSLALNADQELIMKKILYASFCDVMYTILLGIDGCASIGTTQQLYRLYDETGNEITGSDLECQAWEYFHNREDEY